MTKTEEKVIEFIFLNFMTQRTLNENLLIITPTSLYGSSAKVVVLLKS